MTSRRSLSTLAALLLCLLCCTAFALDPHRSMSQYLRDTWSTEDTFPGGQITSIAQTADGCLWVGGEKGLVRFDGLGFRLLRESRAGVPITHVLGLATDAGGGLWIWMQGANVLRYYNGRFENVISKSTLPDENVTAMSPSSDGGVLLSTVGQKTFEYRDGQIQDVGTIDVAGTLILSNAKTADGRIWAGTSDNGLFYLQGGRGVRMDVGFAQKKINALLPGPHNTLWVGTDEGLFVWDGQQMSNSAVPLPLRSDSVFAISSDRDGNVWAGTTHGLYRFEIKAGQADRLNAIRDLAATALFEDREGDLWIGGSQELQRWRDSVFVAYSVPAETPHRGAGPIYAASDGRLWFGPASGGLASVVSGKVERSDVAHLGNDIVYSLSGSGKDLWIGRQRGGLTHLIPGASGPSSKTYTQAEGLAQNSIYAVLEAHDGTVWAGTLNAGLSRLQTGVFKTFTTADGLASDTITDLQEDPTNRLWVATPNGLSVLNAGEWHTLDTRNGLPSDEVTALARAESAGVSGMWIGTANGLALFSSEQIRTFERAPEVLHQPVLGIAEDRVGFLWLTTPDHVMRLDPRKLLAGTLETDDVREYDRNDGLPSSEGTRRSRAMLADAEGRIWISTRGGLVATDPAAFTRTPIGAGVEITGLLADGRAMPLQDARIPASQRRITFQFSGVSLPVPEHVRFRYRLDSFDKGWSEATPTREAIYTHLDPGSYRFHVIASNSDGVWNSFDSSLPLIVEPATWQTWWFRLCSVVIGLVTIWWTYLLRMRQLANRLHLRFEERLAERMRIAQDLHDTLLQGFLSASLQLDVATEYVPRESPASPMLSRVLVLMRQVSEDCRNSLLTLRSGDRFKHNLEIGLSSVPQDLGLDTGALYRVAVNGSPQPLQPLCSDEVYLIGREAVLNAFRHANATNIEVELVYEKSGLHLFVRDDGIGIDEAVAQSGKEKHWGLTGMRERAMKVGGQFRVWSRPAKGTEIELMIPGSLAYLRNDQRGVWVRIRTVLSFQHRSS